MRDTDYICPPGAIDVDFPVETGPAKLFMMQFNANVDAIMLAFQSDIRFLRNTTLARLYALER